MALPLVEGWTDTITYQLIANDLPYPLIGTATTTFLLYDNTDTPVTIAGVLSTLTASTGVVSYTPAAADLKASLSPYKVRFAVSIGTDTAFFPQDLAETWIVRKP